MDYEKQANDFLEATGTGFNAEFVRHGSMKWDERGETRDIYKITLTRGTRTYSFEFGQSLVDSGGIVWCDGKGKTYRPHETRSKGPGKEPVSTFPVRKNSFGWHKTKGKAPTAYDALACLSGSAYCPISLEEFCGDYGYDTDSIKAKETWMAVLEERAAIERLWSPDEIERLVEIQ